MELSVREWMIIIGALLIVAVLLDGYRRIRNENRHRIKVSLSRQAYRQALNPAPVVEAVEERGPNPELPNGGARVIGKRKQSLQLDQSVPVLLESVEIPPQPVDDLITSEAEPMLGSALQQRDFNVDADLHDTDHAEPDRVESDYAESDDFESDHVEPAAITSSQPEPLMASPDDEQFDSDTAEPQRTAFIPEPLFAVDRQQPARESAPQLAEECAEESPVDVPATASSLPVAEMMAERRADAFESEERARRDETLDDIDTSRPNSSRPSLHENRVGLWDDEPESAADEVNEVEERRSPWHGFSFLRRDAQPSEPVQPQVDGGSKEVLAIYVVARDGSRFKGQDLLQLLLACDLRFGKMNIFHRHEKSNGRGAVQFSVANIAEPGTFDLDRIDEFSTAGVCLFLVLPGPEAPYKAFDYMVETAQVLVKHLDGELRDDAHSALTRQTLEHCRQRIRDFERKQLTLHL